MAATHHVEAGNQTIKHGLFVGAENQTWILLRKSNDYSLILSRLSIPLTSVISLRSKPL